GSGVAVIVECLTDNRNRTGSEIRSAFSRNGGSMAEPGAVAWQFERKGVVMVAKGPEEDEVMLVGLEAGADDLSDNGDEYCLTCPSGDAGHLKEALQSSGFEVTSADVGLIPSTTVGLTNEADARKVLRLIDALEDHDDVQAVYANFDIPDDILEAVEA
ncbi:MAG: YebC/PmpR family DNA-binding transcriptional regulator, partial [Acidimicrobiales bacterium]